MSRPAKTPSERAKKKELAYFVPGQGQPKWVPSPQLRRQGWVTIPLRGADGEYLPLAAARDMARAINQDRAALAAGADPQSLTYRPGDAPKNAPRGGRTLHRAMIEWQGHRHWRNLSAASRTNYRSNLSRFIDWAGGEHPSYVDRAALNEFFEAEWDRLYALKSMGLSEDAYQAARHQPRRRKFTDHGTRYLPEVREARWDELDAAREEGRNIAGQSKVNATIRAISAFYNFIIDELQWPQVTNPAARFGLRGTKPRLRVPTDAELAALIDTAQDMGQPGVADALILMANLAPRPQDLVTWPLAMLDEGHITGRVKKTGAVVSVKLGKRVTARLMAIRTRRRLAGHSEDLAVQSATGRAYSRADLGRAFAEVRSKASQTRASLADIHLYDFRKMGITRLAAANVSRDAIAAITGHSFATINDILDHYIVPTASAAAQAVDQLDDHLDQRGIEF